MADEIDPVVVLDAGGAETVRRLLKENPGPNAAMRELFKGGDEDDIIDAWLECESCGAQFPWEQNQSHRCP